MRVMWFKNADAVVTCRQQSSVTLANEDGTYHVQRYKIGTKDVDDVQFGVQMAGEGYRAALYSPSDTVVIGNRDYEVLASTGDAFDAYQGSMAAQKPSATTLNAMCLRDKKTGRTFITFGGMEPKQGVNTAVRDYMSGLALYWGNACEQLKEAIDFTTGCLQRFGQIDAAYGHSMGASLAAGTAGLHGIPVGGFEMQGTKGNLGESVAKTYQQYFDMDINAETAASIMGTYTMYNVCSGTMGRWTCNGSHQDVPVYLIHEKSALPEDYLSALFYGNIAHADHSIIGTHRKVMNARPGNTLVDLAGEDSYCIMKVHIAPKTPAAAVARNAIAPLEGAYQPITLEYQRAMVDIIAGAPDVTKTIDSEMVFLAAYLKDDGYADTSKPVNPKNCIMDQTIANTWAHSLGALRAFSNYLTTR